MNQSPKISYGLTVFGIFRRAVLPVKNGVARISSHSLRSDIGSENRILTDLNPWNSRNLFSPVFLPKMSFPKHPVTIHQLPSFSIVSALRSLPGVRQNCWLHWSAFWSHMFELADGITVYLTCGVTDLRKSYHGLAAIIKLKFHLEPYSRCMFAFCNRRRTFIKILQWDGSGFWILMKRLDRDSFHWPDAPDELKQIILKEIHWLCDGLSINPKGAFKDHQPKIVVWPG